MSDVSKVRDTFSIAMEMARDLYSGAYIVGYGIIELIHPDGSVGLRRPFANLVTDTGDTYYAQQGIVGVMPVNSTGAAAKVSGMQLGTNSATAPSKNGAGAAMVAFISGAGVITDGGFPTALTLGPGAGAEITYKTTFNAGVGTSTTVNEATLTFSSPVTTASTAANTIARILTGTINKGAADALAITWKHKFLGA